MKIYHFDGQLLVRQTEPRDFAKIQALCLRVYPFSAPWGLDQLGSHQEVFPQGQLVIEEQSTGRIVAMCASLIVYWDDYDIEDAWRDFTDHGYFRNHDPVNGRTLYGAEVIVDPDMRGHGLGKLLYAARRTLVRELGLLRIRAGARLRGYSQFSSTHKPIDYLLEIVRGTVFDPTISFQMKQGFHVMALVPGYLPNDPETLGWAVAIEWLNRAVADPEDLHREALRYERLFRPLGCDGAELYKAVCLRQSIQTICTPSESKSLNALNLENSV
jgi:GNAT superfamily N-acetyltransferase